MSRLVFNGDFIEETDCQHDWVIHPDTADESRHELCQKCRHWIEKRSKCCDGLVVPCPLHSCDESSKEGR